MKRPVSQYMFRFGGVLVVFLVAVCTSIAGPPEGFKRPSIEAAQRALQERYLAWTITVRANGDPLDAFPAKMTWPALSDGTSPGDFPKDCFYDKELFDTNTGEVNYVLLCYLVADLANKTTYLDGDDFVSPSFVGRLAGLPGFPTVPAPVFPGTRVDPGNYAEFFRIICDEIKNRNHPRINLFPTGNEDVINAGGITRNGFAAVERSGFPACSTATTGTLADWNAYSDVLTPRAILSRSDGIEYNGSFYSATIGNIHGRYGFDHSEFGKLGGSAEAYLYLLDINDWRVGRPSNVPLTAQNAPLQKYKELAKVTSFALSDGSKYFTPEYAGGDLSFVSPCPEGITSNRFGYMAIVEVVATPKFKYNVDSLTVDCPQCEACQNGSCPAGGNSTATAGSISYSVPLGGGVDGSAGAISLYSPTANFLLASPLGLEISAAEGAIVIGDVGYENIPRQIVVPQGLVDLTVEEPFKRYAMRFFDKANQGSQNGRFYQPVPGSEYKKIVVENPGLNARIIQGTMDIKTNTVAISAPNHGLTPGSYYIMRVDADSGALPEGWTIGRVNRKNLYYIYAVSSTTLAFLYFDPSGQPFLDSFKDAVSGQVLKISSPFPFGNVVITETTASVTRTFNYTYSIPNTGVTLANLVETNGTRVRAKSVQTTTVDETHLTELNWERDGNGNVITKTERKYRVFPWNFFWGDSKRERQTLVEETLDPDGAALKTTYRYNDDEADYGPNYSHLVEVSHSNGSWERYEYDGVGRAIKTYSAFMDSSPSSDPATCRVMERSSATGTPVADQDGDGIPEVLLSSVERILGNEVARSYELSWSRTDSQNRRRVTNVRCLETGAAWDAASNARSESWSYVDGRFSGRLAKHINEAGVLTVYSYAADLVTGAQTVTTKVGTPTANGEDVSAGTQTVTLTNASGTAVDTTATDVGSGIVLSRQFTPSQYIDAFGRTTRVNYLDGTFSSTIYEDCCGAVTRIDRDGSSTRRQQDPSGFVTKITRDGIQERFAEAYTPSGDLKGFTRSTFRQGRGNMPEVLMNVETFDPAGRLIATRDSRDGVERITRFAEGRDSDGSWTRTTTSPDGTVQTTVFYRDGGVREERRAGVVRARFQYGVESSTHDGKAFHARTTKEIQVGDNESEAEWTKQFTDPLGHGYRMEWPDANGEVGAIALNFFDMSGHLIRQVDADGVTTLFSQDLLGNTHTRALDLNRNGVIDLAGPDRITRTRRTVLSLPNRGDVIQTTTEVWEHAGNDQPTSISVSEQSTSGLDNWTTNYGLMSHTQQSFPGGGVTRTVAEDPDQTVRTISAQRGVVLAQKIEHPSFGTLAETANTLDGLDRLETSVDALTGAKTTITYYDNDLVRTKEMRESATSDPQRTEFLYDNMNRLKTTILPNNARSEVRYLSGGSVKARFGANTLPIEYTYDRQDRVRTLTTWQHFNDAAESGISGSAITTWVYNARGQLRQKRDNSGLGPIYTYTPAGRLRTRESARMGSDGSNPILTTYSYGAGGATDMTVESGDVMGIYYSNDAANTPKVENRYDRRGRPEAVTDASGTRQLTYENGNLDTETYLAGAQISPNLFGGYRLDRDFDALHRYSGIKIGNSSSEEIYRIGYQYDAASRLRAVDFAEKTVTYAYEPANTARTVMIYSSASGPFLSVTQNYDALNRLTGRVSTAGIATKKVTYEFDSLNRRRKATRENGSYWNYGYDVRGQLNSAENKDAAGTAMAGGTLGYAFDDIGNRITATNDGRVTSYTANLLNQYIGIAPPLMVDVVGMADPAAAITVDGSPVATRSNRDFASTVDVRSGASGPAHWRTIEVTGTLTGGGVNGANRTATETRGVYVPETPAALQYDADGNLVEDELWHYAWDAENRLIAMENRAALVTPITGDAQSERKRLEFGYDSNGRRTKKRVYSWTALTPQWTLSSHLNFLYDGWNLLCELDQLPNGSAIRSYAWGIDLSGTLQGAGGVGGLLFSVTSAGTYAPIYDGNGNVTSLVNSASGSLVAEFEYDPFGNRSGGLLPNICTFGWSTKYADHEIGLLYYGFRYYHSVFGRWLSRDPIGHKGGLNLYGIVANDPIGAFDMLGLFKPQYHRSITVDGLANTGFTRSAINVIAEANVGQDDGAVVGVVGARGGPFFDPLNHGDDNRIEETINRVGQRISNAANNNCLTCDNVRDMLREFGRALHAVQDLYAHSTFVEVSGADATTPDETPVWDFFNAAGVPNIPDGVVTGVYRYPRDNAPGISHLQLNKDDPGSPRGSQRNRQGVSLFEQAQSAATAHTEQLGTEFFNNLTQAQRAKLQECFR